MARNMYFGMIILQMIEQADIDIRNCNKTVVIIAVNGRTDNTMAKKTNNIR
jgi:hypothetical protein